MNCNIVFIRNLNRKKLLSLATIRNKTPLKNAGFSLLEFAIVLIIVIMLCAVLLYKIDFIQGDNYTKSSMQLTAKSLQAAVKSTRHLWLTKGSQGVAENPQKLKKQTFLLQGFGNENVLMSENGWPVDALELDTGSTKDQGALKAQSATILNNSICTRLWEGLLKNTSPKVKTFSGKSSEPAQAEFTYLAEFNQGVCIYRYLLVDSDWRIEYDLGTGHVSTFFE